MWFLGNKGYLILIVVFRALVSTYFVYTMLQLAWHLCMADVVRELTISDYKYVQEWCGSSL